MFASLLCNFCRLFKGLSSGIGEMSLAEEENAGTGENCPPSKYVKKKISRRTQAYFSTLDLTQMFE